MKPDAICVDCGKPATGQVWWPIRKEGPYPFCDACTYHSIKNRNGVKFEEIHVFRLVVWFRNKIGEPDCQEKWAVISDATMGFYIYNEKPEYQFFDCNYHDGELQCDSRTGEYEIGPINREFWDTHEELLQKVKRRVRFKGG